MKRFLLIITASAASALGQDYCDPDYSPRQYQYQRWEQQDAIRHMNSEIQNQLYEQQRQLQQIEWEQQRQRSNRWLGNDF